MIGEGAINSLDTDTTPLEGSDISLIDEIVNFQNGKKNENSNVSRRL